MDATRLPIERAVQEIPLIVKEALEPMDDITVGDVMAAPNADDPRSIDITILYTINEDGTVTQEQEVQSVNLTVAG